MADLTARITEILRDNIPIRRSDCKLGVSDLVLKVTAHELAAAAEQHYRPRIETVEELDSLPEASVVRSDNFGVVFEKSIAIGGADVWISLGAREYSTVALPATVLWSPGAGE